MTDRPTTLSEIGVAETDGRVVNFPSGAAIMREDEPGDVLYVLAKGRAEVTIAGEHLAFITGVSVVGEMALLETGVRSATVTAVEPCVTLRVTREQFRAIAARDARFLWFIMETLSSRLRKTSAGVAAVMRVAASVPDAPKDLLQRLIGEAEAETEGRAQGGDGGPATSAQGDAVKGPGKKPDAPKAPKPKEVRWSD